MLFDRRDQYFCMVYWHRKSPVWAQQGWDIVAPFIERVAEADALDIRAEKVATNRKTTKLKKLSWKEPKILWAESPEHDGTQLYKLEAATPPFKNWKDTDDAPSVYYASLNVGYFVAPDIVPPPTISIFAIPAILAQERIEALTSLLSELFENLMPDSILIKKCEWWSDDGLTRIASLMTNDFGQRREPPYVAVRSIAKGWIALSVESIEKTIRAVLAN